MIMIAEDIFFPSSHISIATVRGPFIVNTAIQCIVSSDTLRCTTVVTAQALSLYSLSVSQIRAWFAQVADRRLSVVVMSEVEYAQVKRLITQHLRPFFASPFILEPIMSKTLANQTWAGSNVWWQQLPWWRLVWQGAHVLLFVYLSRLAGWCKPPPPPLLLLFIHSQKKVENKCVLWITEGLHHSVLSGLGFIKAGHHVKIETICLSILPFGLFEK